MYNYLFFNFLEHILIFITKNLITDILLRIRKGLWNNHQKNEIDSKRNKRKETFLTKILNYGVKVKLRNSNKLPRVGQISSNFGRSVIMDKKLRLLKNLFNLIQSHHFKSSLVLLALLSEAPADMDTSSIVVNYSCI